MHGRVFMVPRVVFRCINELPGFSLCGCNQEASVPVPAVEAGGADVFGGVLPFPEPLPVPLPLCGEGAVVGLVPVLVTAGARWASARRIVMRCSKF